jgi:uncharacterized lipoprotein YmbA
MTRTARATQPRAWTRPGGAILGLALLLITVGCAETQPTRFYTLSGLHTPAEASRSLPGGQVVGVGPVSLPDYLDRPQIVTRTAANQVSLGEFDSWIEPLVTMVPRILTDNLSALLGTDEVVTIPQRRSIDFAYQVEVEVSRFDFDATGRAVLDARWHVLDGRERSVDRGRATLSERASNPNDYGAIAAAMSRALGALSEQIADAILDHAQG